MCDYWQRDRVSGFGLTCSLVSSLSTSIGNLFEVMYDGQGGKGEANPTKVQRDGLKRHYCEWIEYQVLLHLQFRFFFYI